MSKDIHPRVKIIINQAIKEAESLDDVKVRPEHIIISLLNDDTNECVKIFKSLNVNITDLHDNVSDYLRKIDIIPRIAVSSRRKPAFSEETKAIFKAVDKECDKLKNNLIDARHVMLAILASKLPINDILNTMGINYKSFNEKLQGMKEETKNGAFDDSDMDDTNDIFKKKIRQNDSKSKTPVLDNFCRDISKAVDNNEIDPVIGRQIEIKRVSQILSRRKKNNPILIGEPGVGKAQPLDARVLTPSGWTTIGNINIGDDVLTPEGKTSKVLGVYPQGEKDIYRITFKDGKNTEACGEHLWKVYGIPEGKSRKKSWSIINTLDIKNKLENTKYKLKVPLVSGNLFNDVKDADLMVPPYLMGLLLGDGSFNENSIKLSSDDNFIIEKVNDLLDDKHHLVFDSGCDYLLTRKEGKGYKGSDNGNYYVKEIRKLDLQDKKSNDKFIPKKYKNISYNQKIELLQGLMDSDGTVDKTSHLSYSTVSLQLAKDIQELVWSIGGVCNLKEKHSTYVYQGVKRLGQLSYNLNIRYNKPKTIMSLPRKINRISNNYQYKDTLKNNIVNVKLIGKKQAQCIMVDDENHLYVTDDYIVTHNTESIREIARRLIPNVTFIIPEFRTSDDLTSIMEACEIFENAVIVMDDIDLYLGSRDHGNYTNLLGQFLSFFDGVKKRKISLLASTNDKGLVDKAAERPGRFNFTLDYSFLDDDQIVKVCNIHLPEKWRVEGVYDALKGNVGGKKAKITGAFIANLADNIKEMSEGDEEWGLEDTVSLIKESYKGFYNTQISKDNPSMGYQSGK